MAEVIRTRETKELSFRSVSAHYLLAWIFVFILALFLRLLYLSNDYHHPDEIITIGVIDAIRETGHWDTNWRNADLPSDFKYDQYNFSSYLYATYLFGKLVGSFNLYVYRLFSALCSGSIIILLFFLACKTQEFEVSLCSAFLLAFAPILIQDAHYARPEAFASLLTVAITWLCWPRREMKRYPLYLAALFTGILIACKLTMVFFFWLPFFPVMLRVVKWKEGIAFRQLLTFALSVMILLITGFFIGVPGAFTKPRVYINGVLVLMRQYHGIHPGHSHLSGGPIADLLVGYLGTTLGWPMLMFFVAGLVLKPKEQSWDTVALLHLPVLFFIAYFSIQSVFFERNLSHIIPLYVLGSVHGMKSAYHSVIRGFPKVLRCKYLLLLPLLAAVSVSPFYYSYRLVFDIFSGREAEMRADVRRSIAFRYWGRRFLRVHLLSDHVFQQINAALKRGDVPIVLDIMDLGDDITESNVVRLKEEYEIREIGSFASIFKHVPFCTLHSYHSWTDRYFLILGFR